MGRRCGIALSVFDFRGSLDCGNIIRRDLYGALERGESLGILMQAGQRHALEDQDADLFRERAPRGLSQIQSFLKMFRAQGSGDGTNGIILVRRVRRHGRRQQYDHTQAHESGMWWNRAPPFLWKHTASALKAKHI